LGSSASRALQLAASSRVFYSAASVVGDAFDEGVVAHMIKFLLWLLLFVLCWPLAILALVLWPLVWLLLLPFRLVGIAVEGVFEFLKALLFLPARLLGGRP